MRMTSQVQVLLLITAFIHGTALGADPPSTMNYQGVLRDAAGTPRTGTFDMVFRFYDVQTSGGELLVDAHTGGGAVVVTNGLFDVQLGGGMVTDGWGPGTYTSLGTMVQDYPDIWMQITIGAEMLAPLVPIQASAYALNSARLQGQPASSFLDTSSTSQAKSGPLVVNGTFPHAVTGSNSYNGATGALGSTTANAGVLGLGGPAGGFFFHTSGSQATIANYAEGIQAMGATTGADFTNHAGIGKAILGAGKSGITAYGASADSAGHFVGRQWLGFFPPGWYYSTVDLAQEGIGIIVDTQFDGPAGQFTATVGGYSATIVGGLASGRFDAPTSEVFTRFAAEWYVVGFDTNGIKAFIQNHPTDPSRLIAYSALEGPEAGTYTRGSGSIRAGEARIALDPTFALTTDPDIGLTAIVTPRRPRAEVYVASVSTKELVVRSGAASAGEVAFDYVVNGLRLGFENRPVILPSDTFPNATVPNLDAAAAKLAAMPEDSRSSTPLSRLSAERASVGAGAPDLAGTRALIAGINSREHARRALSTGAGSIAAAQPNAARHSLSMPVAMEVQAGDVLSYDGSMSGSLRLAEEARDPAVVGVVMGPAGSLFRDQAPIAVAGTVVPCNVDASYRPIAVGDLLAASATPGMAMHAGADPRQGTVFGRALESLPAGTGSIRILVVSR